MDRNKHILLVAIVLFSSLSMARVAEDDPVPDKNGFATVVAPGDSESNNRDRTSVRDRSLPRDTPVYRLYCYRAVAG